MEATPAVVQDFKAELDTLFHSRLPVSRAKMTAVTKKAMKAIKYYKHIVMIVEKFILKASPLHKLPGLYVVDSIVRQSRHQYTSEPKEVYSPRFAKNFEKTFTNLFQCTEDDSVKIVRVLNLWKKNNIYQNDVIEPLINLAPPTAIQPSPQEQPSSTQVAPLEEEEGKDQATILVHNQGQIDSLLEQQQHQLESLIEAGGGQPMISLLLNKAQQLHELQAIQQKLITDNNSNTSSMQQPETQSPSPVPVHKETRHSMSKLSEFSKALLDDFDYSSDEDDGGQPRLQINNGPSPMMSSDGPLPLPLPSDTLSATAFIDELNKQFMQTKELLDNNNPPLPPRMDHDTPPCPANMDRPPPHPLGNWLPASPPDYHHPPPPPRRWSDRWSPPHFPHPPNEFFPPPPRRYPPGPPPPDRFSPRSPNYRPRDRSPFRHDRERSPPYRGRRDRSPYRGRSPPYRRRGSPPYREERKSSTEWDRRGRDQHSPDRGNRESRIHPPPKSEHTTVCSNTVWIGHLGKNTAKEQIQEAFDEFGPVKSIDHVLARGCAYVVMENRKDAVRAVDRLVIKGQKSKVAWAPGRGLKDKAYKEFWNVEKGISHIPHEVIKTAGGTMESLSDGGWVDHSTLPSDIDNTVEMTIVN